MQILGYFSPFRRLYISCPAVVAFHVIKQFIMTISVCNNTTKMVYAKCLLMIRPPYTIIHVNMTSFIFPIKSIDTSDDYITKYDATAAK